MADTKITALPAASSVNLTDLIIKVNNPSGTAVTQRATVSQLQSALTATDTWSDSWEADYYGGNGSTSLGDAWALTGTNAGSDGIVTGVSKTQLPGNQYSTNSATNAQASWGGVAQYTFGSRLKSVMAILLTDKTTVRSWIGFTNATGLQQLASATPSFSYAAFRFDTSSADASWQAMCGNGVSQTITDTLVVPSITVTQIMRIEWSKDATSVLFYINNALVATIAATLPAQGAVLRQMNGIQTFANVQKFIIVSSVKVRMTSIT